jgi:autotransporter family porin
LVNQGTISGGLTGFGYSGTGVAMTGGVLINQGVITSAAGGAGGPDQNDGLVLSGGSVSNTGTITGGQGPNGGVGVSMTGGAFTNSGMVTGGNANQGPGGAGLYLSGATFTNAGTISGGSNSYGGMNDAVQFGSLAATLVIDPGAVFDGNVAGNSAVHDVLELSGTAAGTLSGLGTQFTGFTTIKEDFGANWSFSGANTLGAGTEIKMYGRLGVPGQLTDAGTILVGHGGLLRAGGYGAILVGGISLYSGSLAEGATGTFVVGNTLAGAQEGAITVEAGFAISGHGTVGGVAGNKVIDNGTITASGGGTLNVALAVSGTGTLALDIGTELIAHSAVSVENIIFNAGGNETLAFLAPQSVTGTITGFGAGDTIDIETQKVKAVNYVNGVLFLLGAHNALLETLDVSGSFVSGNFDLSSDHHGGTDISYITQAAHAPAGPMEASWQSDGADRIDPLLAALQHFGR